VCDSLVDVGGSDAKLKSDMLLCLHRSYRRHRVHPDLPWISGAVYAVAVHWRRGDIAQPDSSCRNHGHGGYTRGVVPEEQLISAMEMMRNAVIDAGENHGQAIVFHVFTQVGFNTFPAPESRDCSKSMSRDRTDETFMQGKANCCHKLSPRNDTILHIAAETNVEQKENQQFVVPLSAVRNHVYLTRQPSRTCVH
jgi:hypothetical protein